MNQHFVLDLRYTDGNPGDPDFNTLSIVTSQGFLGNDSKIFLIYIQY